MRRLFLLVLIAGPWVVASVAGTAPRSSPTECTPAYFELERRVAVDVGASELSFRLLAVGCREELGEVWPPAHELVEQQLQPELQEPHPVQILMMIRDRSTDLRVRLTARLNEGVFNSPVVYDLFLFEARAAER